MDVYIHMYVFCMCVHVFMCTCTCVFVFMYVCICVYVCVCAHARVNAGACGGQKSMSDIPDLQVTGVCEQLYLGAGKQTWVLFMSSMHS